MEFKIISHNIEDCKQLLFMRTGGKYLLHDARGLFKKDRDFDIVNNITAITLITEDNKKSFVGKAGWGLLGGIALGPVGLLAGVLAGGNKKLVACAIEVYPHYKLMANLDLKAYHELLTMAEKNRQNGKSIPDSDIIKEEKVEDMPSTLTLDDLPKLKGLMDSGVITQEEFDAAKKKILG